MPSRGFVHPLTRERLDWDGFDNDTTKGGLPSVNPWLASFVAACEQGDLRHAGVEITATRCTGCPRATFIKSFMDYWLDVRKIEARTRGTALHGVAGKHYNPEVFMTEETDPVRMEVEGTLFKVLVERGDVEVDGKYVTPEGVVVNTKIDVIKRDMTWMGNLKFSKDWSVKWRPKNGIAKEDHQIQGNIERLLVAQQRWALDMGFDPDQVVVVYWDHALGDKEGHVPLVVPHRDEAWILEQKPGGGIYTVGEIVQIGVTAAQKYEELKAKGTPFDIEELVASVPCTGETQWNNKGCSHYCDVEQESQRLMRQFGPPEQMQKNLLGLREVEAEETT